MTKFLEFFTIIGTALSAVAINPVLLFLAASGIYCLLQIKVACSFTRNRIHWLARNLYSQTKPDGSLNGPGHAERFAYKSADALAIVISMYYAAKNCNSDPTYRRLKIFRNILLGFFGLIYVAVCYALTSDWITSLIVHIIPTTSANHDTYCALACILFGITLGIILPLAYDQCMDKIQEITRKAANAQYTH